MSSYFHLLAFMLISIKNINKRYGEVQALKDITFDNLTSGNCLGILGKNGAGKTTLFNILADLVEPDMGYILINDAQITPSEKKWKQQIGITSDEIPLIEDFTGAEFLKFTGLLYNLSLMEVKQRSSSLGNFFFDDVTILSKKIESYSLGMRKKIALCAMVALLAGLMSTRVIKGLIEYRIKGKLLLVFFFITVMGLAVLSYLKFRILLTPYLAVLMGCVTIDMRVESKKYSDVTTQGVSFGNQSLWQYFFKNRKSRITLSFAFILKVVLLAIFLRLPEDMNWLANVFIISPVILYTYLFNNAWGFFPEIWIQTQIRYCSWKQRLWFYIKLISYPILIDALITFVALIIFEKLDLFHAYIYLSSVVMMTVTGFVVSLTNATRVHKLVNFLSGHRNTSITGILLNYLLIGILWLPAIRPGFIYIALTACLIWLLAIIFFWKHLYQKRYRIFTQLKG